MYLILRAIALILAILALLLRNSQVVLCSPTATNVEENIARSRVPKRTLNPTPRQPTANFNDKLRPQTKLKKKEFERPEGNSKFSYSNISKRIQACAHDFRDRFKPLSRLEYPTMYWQFFQAVETITEFSSNGQLISLAKMVEVIARRRRSLESWHNWVLANEETMTDIFQISQEALLTNLNTKERLWVLGIVAALEEDLPPNSAAFKKHLDNNFWGEPCSLEIKAAKG